MEEYFTVSSIIFGLIFLSMGFFIGRAYRGNLIEDIISHTITNLLSRGYLKARVSKDGVVSLVKWEESAEVTEKTLEVLKEFQDALKEDKEG